MVRLLAALRQAFGKLAVMVPIAVIELDEAHAALGQPAREQAVVCKRPRLARIRPIRSKTLCGSFERSVSSGTDDCIRNAISYCAMRVAISGSPILVQIALR